MAEMLELLIDDFEVSRINSLKDSVPKESDMCEQVQMFTEARKNIKNGKLETIKL